MPIVPLLTAFRKRGITQRQPGCAGPGEGALRVDHCGGVVRRSLLCVLAALGALALVPAALGGTLSGSVVLDPAPGVDLTQAGAIDWAIWGYAGGGTSTTLTPDVRKSGGTAPRRAEEHRPGADGAAAWDRPVRRAVRFSWTNGAPTGSATASAPGCSTTAGRRRLRLASTSRRSAKASRSTCRPARALRTLRVYVATSCAVSGSTAITAARARATAVRASSINAA